WRPESYGPTAQPPRAETMETDSSASYQRAWGSALGRRFQEQTCCSERVARASAPRDDAPPKTTLATLKPSTTAEIARIEERTTGVRPDDSSASRTRQTRK